MGGVRHQAENCGEADIASVVILFSSKALLESSSAFSSSLFLSRIFARAAYASANVMSFYIPRCMFLIIV